MTARVYYKATAPSGRDFYSGTVDYAAALGKSVDIGAAARKRPAECCTDTVLHASDTPSETLVGGSWPCRLFEVTGRSVAQEGHKYGFRSLTVVREIDATLALGPNGAEVAALVDRIRGMTPQQIDAAGDAARVAAWGAAGDAARGAAGVAARVAAGDAARGAAGNAARGAAGNAARVAAGNAARVAAGVAAWGAAGNAATALTVRDLIATEHYDTLTRALRVAGVTVHPDDPAMNVAEAGL